MRSDLQHDWTHLDNNDVEWSCSIFLDEFNGLLQKHTPVNNFKTNVKKKLPVGSHVKAQIRIRQRRLQRYIQTRDPEQYRLYCKQRNLVKKLTKKAMIKAEKDLAKKIKTNPKAFWAHVNSKLKTRQT